MGGLLEIVMGFSKGTCHQIHVNSGVCDLMYILGHGALC